MKSKWKTNYWRNKQKETAKYNYKTVACLMLAPISISRSSPSRRMAGSPPILSSWRKSSIIWMRRKTCFEGSWIKSVRVCTEWEKISRLIWSRKSIRTERRLKRRTSRFSNSKSRSTNTKLRQSKWLDYTKKLLNSSNSRRHMLWITKFRRKV